MASISKRVSERLNSGIKRFQPIIASAKNRDVNESDTSIIVTDMLSELFGYDKYSEVTSEYAIRGTACDLAIKLEGSVKILIEVKAVGLELKDHHIKQAVDYAANQGLDWVILTNGVCWRIYKVLFSKPIDQELVAEFDVLTLNPRSAEDLELLFLLSKEGWGKSILNDYHDQKQALSPYTIAAMTSSDRVVTVIRRELKKLSPDVKIDAEQICKVLTTDVFKREVVEGEKADEARRKVTRFLNKTAKVEDTPKIHAALAMPASGTTLPNVPTPPVAPVRESKILPGPVV